MNPAAAFAYDTVEYPSAALSHAHPGHLHAIGRMFGIDSAPVEHCRYLEIGCGDATHLIATAIGLPHATFVGIDLSAVAIERGKQTIAELGLPNVSLYVADLTAWEPPVEEFDYVVSHGLFAWIPAPVRDGLLALMARCLRKHGIGFVSYNAYPGCYVRRMLWEMLRHHVANQNEPAKKMQGAIELLQFLKAGRPKKSDVGLSFLESEVTSLLETRDPRVIYHDDLGEFNAPVYFHEFMAHASRHGLRFVAEAEQHLMETRGFPPDVAGILNGLAAKDVLQKEQYVDFLLCRRFRQTLLSSDGGTPRDDPDAGRITTLLVSGEPKLEGKGDPDLSPKVPITFRTAREAVARTDLAIGKAALLVLASRWPARIPFNKLVELAVAKLGRPAEPTDEASLASLLSAVWMAGMIELHGHGPRYAEEPSERPVASPLARLQVRNGPFATTLLHTTMRFEDEPSRLLVRLLDGTRDRKQLAREMIGAFPPDKRPDPESLNTALERNLERLAKAGLLVG